MRKDSLGLFWEEIDDKTNRQLTVLKEKGWVEVLAGYWCQEFLLHDKEVDYFQHAVKMDVAYLLAKNTSEKREPPEPVWLDPNYLPGLEESLAFDVALFTEEELIAAGTEWVTGHPMHELIYDIECYSNYFLIAFTSKKLDKVVYFEMINDSAMHIEKLKWVMDNFCIIGFNSIRYDIVIAALALAGKSNATMKTATSALIEYQERPSDVLKQNKVKKLVCNHIDIMEVAPLFGSLKIYGGRLHAPKMQDLPFPPEVVLSDAQIAIVRFYCINDLTNTQILYDNLQKEISLRILMGQQYGLDLRSKSDAQIAEAVITEEVSKMNRCRLHRPKIEPGTTYYYQVPDFIQYQSPLMQWVLNEVRNAPFVVSEKGSVTLPESLKGLKINIANSTYKLGIGGLHSTEKKTSQHETLNYTLEDVDVESYYPRIILNQGLYPKHLGTNFLIVYNFLVERRLAAKLLAKTGATKEIRAKAQSEADSLKIVINGSFGKLGSMYSVLYAPDLLMQVTISGQLSLLMLIERLELAGINVVSANTDGIVINCRRDMLDLRNQILDQWQLDTAFKLDGTPYKALYSRDVNNYIAVKRDLSGVKVKGAYARPGFHKNPTNEICIDALENLLLKGVPVEDTVNACTDITKFVSVRTVKGGGVKDGEFLGKAIRWYYGKNTGGEIVYALSGNKVPRSDGAIPMLQMPNEFPQDVDYNWYINETNKILSQIGY